MAAAKINQKHILAVDDNPADLNYLKKILQAEGYAFHATVDPKFAFDFAESDAPDIVLLDINMPGMDGYEVCERLKADKHTRDVPVIFISSADQVMDKVNAFSKGGVDYILKPYHAAEVVARIKLHLSLRDLQTNLEQQVRERTIELSRAIVSLEEEVDARRRAENELRKHRDHLEELVKERTAQLVAEREAKKREKIASKIVGNSEAIQRVRQKILAVAAIDAPVMIVGETGTGKEMVARSIHENSPRCDKPFVALNCAAFPENIFEAEMFGAEVGAYTNATKRRIGKFEFADGGTLFLDEMESMSLPLQAKILRALQEKVIERLGGNESIQINVRILAAVKGDLMALCNEGRFRNDLCYRLNVAKIDLPSLRERREDIPLLFEHFALEAALTYGRSPPLLSQTQLVELMAYDWPGNVRELHNVADRFALGLMDSGFSIQGGDGPKSKDLMQQVEDFERFVIVGELRQAGGVMAKAAKELGIARNTLFYKIKKHKITDDVYQDPGDLA